ncbi:polyphosphate polymerase domain-containing protein [Brachybacterium sp. JHP9]|uniref:Polyphosphate polymerase domain-containing protein n=1 Tax=Brachybacterium equifaecis TaxID=2910770 RepID=A0ABT0R035_9MICO|nr:polyphosphate polymerase domain-containing protein [Brachybacterium equifaecis]
MTGLERIPGIDLGELAERASLMTRVDRKYLVPLPAVRGLLEALDGGLRVLEIDGARTFRYRSTYYDTADLRSFRDAAGSRRRRFKIRRRDYVDTGASYLEVKTPTGRGETSKQRIEIPSRLPADRPLAGGQLAFVQERLIDAGCTPPTLPLVPILGTTYDRSTLLVESEGSRLTIDAELTWQDLRQDLRTDRAGPPARRRALSGLVVVETKAGTQPGRADRWLWSHAHRPLRLSKYSTGLALLDEALPRNRWHQTLGAVAADAA